MATRQPPGRIPPSRPRAGVRPVDFKPISEWKQEEQSHVLLVYLPGFPKERLKVSEGTNILRIHGERPSGGNKWSRLQEEFRIPEDCDVRGIHAKYEGGVLTITMPKKSSSYVAVAAAAADQARPREEAKTTQEAQPRYAKRQVDGKSTAQQTTSTSSLTSQKGQDDTPPKIAYPTVKEGKQTDGKSLNASSSDKKKAATEPKSEKVEYSTMKEGKQTDGNGLKASSSDQKAATQPKSEKSLDDTPPSTPKIVYSTMEESKQTQGKKLDASSSSYHEKAADEPKSKNGQHDTSRSPSKTAQTDGKSLEAPSSDQKATTIPKPEKGQDDTSRAPLPQPLPKIAYSTIKEGKQTDGKSLEESISDQKAATQPKSEKGRDDTPRSSPKIVYSTMEEVKQTDGKSLEASSSDQKAATEPKSEKGRIGTPDQKATNNSSAGVEKQPDEVKSPPGSTSAEKIVQETIEGKVRSKAEGEPTESIKMPENALEKTKGLVKRLLSQERELMVNMGLAVLLIVALGAYISYTSGRPRRH